MLYAAYCPPVSGSKKEEAARLHAMARLLLSCAMKAEYGAAAGALQVVTGPHGKPAFSNHPAHFSLAHCPGLVCCAVDTAPIGVDAETVREYDTRLARRICTQEELDHLERSGCPEKELCRLWTLKESLMKQCGKGMGYGFRKAAFTFEAGTGKPAPAAAGLFTASFETLPGYMISVCSQNPPPEKVILLELP